MPTYKVRTIERYFRIATYLVVADSEDEAVTSGYDLHEPEERSELQYEDEELMDIEEAE